jgi:hypothetical protein
MFSIAGQSNAENAFMQDNRRRPIDDYLTALREHPDHMGDIHLCEYIVGSPGSDHLYGSSM